MKQLSLPFPTTLEQQKKIPDFLCHAHFFGFSGDLLLGIYFVASYDQGAYDLLEKWVDAYCAGDYNADEDWAALVESVDDYRKAFSK